MSWFKQKRIFMDYASATPILPEVAKAMEEYWSKDFYNPNAIYDEGVKIKLAVDQFKIKIAKLFGAAKEGVIFTSGGTEANVLAVHGVKRGKIIAEPDSHLSVLEAIKGRTLNTDSQGPTLVSSQTTDNVLGRKIREERKNNNSNYPLLHIDASQTAQYFNIGLEVLACDMITLDSAKLYGPKGIGALIIRRGVVLNLPPQGTPAVPLIAGFSKALEVALRDREIESKRLNALSDEFVALVKHSLPQAEIKKTAPNIINISVPGILPEFLVLALDRAGILVSAGPACYSDKPEPPDTPVRFSFGRFTTESDIKKAAEIFCRTVRSVVK